MHLHASPAALVLFSEAALSMGLAMLAGIVVPGGFLSALLGGLLAALPNSYFTAMAFRYQARTQLLLVLPSFTKGLSGKFVITLAGFATVFVVYPSVIPPLLLLAFIGVTLVHCWLTTVVEAYVANKHSPIKKK